MVNVLPLLYFGALLNPAARGGIDAMDRSTM